MCSCFAFPGCLFTSGVLLGEVGNSFFKTLPSWRPGSFLGILILAKSADEGSLRENFEGEVIALSVFSRQASFDGRRARDTLLAVPVGRLVGEEEGDEMCFVELAALLMKTKTQIINIINQYEILT